MRRWARSSHSVGDRRRRDRAPQTNRVAHAAPADERRSMKFMGRGNRKGEVMAGALRRPANRVGSWRATAVAAVFVLLALAWQDPAVATAGKGPPRSGCSTSFGIVPSPNVPPGENVLVAATARTSSDVWAVGYSVNDSLVDRTLTEHQPKRGVW